MKRYFSILGTVAVLATVYVAVAKLGLAMAHVHPSATAVWPPTGVALAAVLVLGYWVWPSILLGAFLANITTEGSIATSLGIAAGNTLEALIGAFLVRRFAKGCNAFDRPEDIFKFIVLAGMVSTAISATFGVTSLSLGGFARWDEHLTIWMTWWSGNMVSDLIVAPLLLVWGAKPLAGWKLRRMLEATSLLILVFVIGQLVFGGWISDPDFKYYLQENLYVPPLLWAAFRFGQLGAVTASFIMSVIAIWGTVNGFGPFALKDAFNLKDTYDVLVLLQLFMGTLGMTSLVVASVLSQRMRGEEKFHRAVESAPNAMIMANHEGRIVLVNEQTERLFGYTRGELLGQSVDILVPKRYRDDHRGHRGTYLREPSARPMGAGRNLYAIRKDGSEVPVEIGLNPVPTEEGVSVLASVVDITERQRAEEELRESEEKFRIITETVPEILFVNRPDGQCDYANQRFYEYTGMPPGTANAFDWTAVLHPEDLMKVKSGWTGSGSTEEPRQISCRFRSAKGTYRWFMGGARAVRNTEGEILKWFWAWTDVDDLVRAEDAIRQSAQQYRKVAEQREEQLIMSDRLVSVGELAASLAHEFNNPLQIITGFTQDLLTDAGPSDNHYQSLKFIDDAAGRCKKIIQDLLDFARPNGINKLWTDLNEVLRKSIELVSGHLKKVGVEIEVEISSILPKIHCDPQQLEQVLLNLFFNAAEAMSSGGTLTIRATVQPMDDGGGVSEVIIAVSDTGTGIDAENLPKIFRPFFTTKNRGGMGLGLSICESIVKKHGGRIAVQSRQGQGTTFLIHLPALVEA